MNNDAPLRPVVVVSQCLGFAAVRYNGQLLQDAFVKALAEHVQFVQVCPEVAIGLGVPRDPIRIVVDATGRRLVQPATGRDLTEPMRRFSESFLEAPGPVDGFILKSRSPSCGIKDVKAFGSESGQPAPKTTGFFAEAVLRRFPNLAVEEEGRLTNFRLRHHFLARLFAARRFREIQTGGAMGDLVQFHTEYKLQLMAHSPSGLNKLGRIVANPASAPTRDVLARYGETLASVMAAPLRPGSTCNVLSHAFGYVSKELKPGERKYFLELMDEFRDDRLPLSALLTVLKSWVLRFDQSYLLQQRFFEPYPRPLMDLTDSAAGKSRESQRDPG